MLKNLSFLALAGAMTFSVSMTGCILVTDDGNDDAADGTTGDGDGDGDGDQTEVGDGDGDSTGETAGDGDGDQTGDGDGDQTGDGDGDQTGDGDGDTPAGSCGWDAAQQVPGYYCGGEGEDPDAVVPYACSEDLVPGEPCGELLTGAGCCDADGNAWYCADTDDGFVIFMDECAA